MKREVVFIVLDLSIKNLELNAFYLRIFAENAERICT